MTTIPTIPGPQASRVNKDSASDTIWYQYELGIGSAVKSSVPNTTKVVAGAGLVGGGALSSDVTLALAATGVTPASYGGASKTTSFTVNEYGQLTAAAEATITVTGLGGVPDTRLINTTAPLTGGGNLTADRTFAITASALTKTDDTNVTLTLGGTPASALLAAASLTLGWTGTLAAGRLNANVVQAITNDTNVTGSITAQNLTLGWAGTLAAARGGTGVSTVPAAGAMLVGNAGATAYGSVAMSGDATLASTGAITVTKINGVDQTTAWSQTTPTPTNNVGAGFTSASAIVRYKQLGKTVFVQIQVTITTDGTAGSTWVNCPLPVNANTTIFQQLSGRENSQTGLGLVGPILGTSNVSIMNYNGTYPAVNGAVLNLGGTYEAA